ncbi:MAG: thioredoxin family protein [Candidatus Paceibacterota bacterium]
MENSTENTPMSAPKAKKPVNVWMIATIVLLIVSIGLGYMNFAGVKIPGVSAGAISSATAANLALEYIKTTYDQTITLNKVYEGQTCFYKIGLNYNGQVVSSYVSTDGKSLFPADPVDISKKKVVGNFETTNEAAICQENGKPIVYFFGTATCPHCQWEKPVINAVAQQFGSEIVFKEDISVDNAPFKNPDVFAKYSPTGGVPVVVLGCKYSRVGSGETDGVDGEKANLTKLICELTNNQPASVCK